MLQSVRVPLPVALCNVLPSPHQKERKLSDLRHKFEVPTLLAVNYGLRSYQYLHNHLLPPHGLRPPRCREPPTFVSPKYLRPHSHHARHSFTKSSTSDQHHNLLSLHCIMLSATPSSSHPSSDPRQLANMRRSRSPSFRRSVVPSSGRRSSHVTMAAASLRRDRRRRRSASVVVVTHHSAHNSIHFFFVLRY